MSQTDRTWHESHRAKVRSIAAALRQRSVTGEVIGEVIGEMAKGDTSHVVPLPGGRPRTAPLDLGRLNERIAVDPVRRICVAESAVPFSRIVTETLRHGLLPKVVPELRGITVGGAVVGCSVESMSFRHGGFHDTCLEYELVTGTGDVITCSRADDPEIFEMIHGSYGTLAVLTALAFELVPASPHVPRPGPPY